jgi:hypothetical protein
MRATGLVLVLELVHNRVVKALEATVVLALATVVVALATVVVSLVTVVVALATLVMSLGNGG